MFLLKLSDRKHSSLNLKVSKQNQSLDLFCYKRLIWISWKINNAWIKNQKNHQETFIEDPPSSEVADLQPTTSLKIIPQETFLAEPIKTWRTLPLQNLFHWHLRQRYHFKAKICEYHSWIKNKKYKN